MCEPSASSTWRAFGKRRDTHVAQSGGVTGSYWPEISRFFVRICDTATLKLCVSIVSAKSGLFAMMPVTGSFRFWKTSFSPFL